MSMAKSESKLPILAIINRFDILSLSTSEGDWFLTLKNFLDVVLCRFNLRRNVESTSNFGFAFFVSMIWFVTWSNTSGSSDSWSVCEKFIGPMDWPRSWPFLYSSLCFAISLTCQPLRYFRFCQNPCSTASHDRLHEERSKTRDNKKRVKLLIYYNFQFTHERINPIKTIGIMAIWSICGSIGKLNKVNNSTIPYAMK